MSRLAALCHAGFPGILKAAGCATLCALTGIALFVLGALAGDEWFRSPIRRLRAVYGRFCTRHGGCRGEKLP